MQQNITFSTAEQPMGSAGVWRITASQKVEQQTLTEHFTFVEKGTRYALPTASVYEQFPPPKQEGDFSEVLPHLLLRGITRAKSLCLLWLTEQDGFSIQQGTLGDFSSLPAGWYAPPLVPMQKLGEDAQTPCTQLVVPWSKLQTALPCAQDMPYLRHLRKVATVKQKATQTLEDGTVLCLFCHRAPSGEAGQSVTVCLVSMEGFDLQRSFDEKTVVMLPLLYSWQFFQQKGSLDFATLASALSVEYFGARRSDLPLLQQGYTPMQHHLRNGETTVSWYRGPLTPVSVAPKPLPENSGLADAYTYYDPEMGMFDVSYAAAWQIGHLLALRSGGFTAKLQRLRTERRKAVLRGQQQQKLKAVWGAKEATEKWAEHLDSLCADCLTAAPVCTAAPVLRSTDSAFWSRSETLYTEQQAELEHWLDRLGTLKDVPFEYLVPQQEMLSPESLRLFYLDKNWVNALQQGALAVGRQGNGDRCHDAVFFSANKNTDTDELPVGFLLRSQIVTHWQGLEVHGYTDPDANFPSALVRLERLGADVMLGIFQEGIQRLELREPPESLHLSCVRSRCLRNIDNANPTEQLFELCVRRDGTINFAETASHYTFENHPMLPDLLAMQLLQTAQMFVVHIRRNDPCNHQPTPPPCV